MTVSIALVAAAGIGLVTTEVASAQGIINNPDPKTINLADISVVLMRIVQYGLAFAGAVGAISITINGYQYVMAAGNPEKLEKAKMGLTWSITGFVLAASAFAIVLLLQNVLRARHKVSEAPGRPNVPEEAGNVVGNLGEIFLVFVAATSMLYLILGGYRLATSQGNPDLMEKGKKAILYSLIGLGVSMISVVIMRTINKTLL